MCQMCDDQARYDNSEPPTRREQFAALKRRLSMRARERRARIDELEEELIEARQGPWPEWAEKLLRILESWGCEYDADDEINLPDELAEWLNGYAGELRRDAERRTLPMTEKA